MLARVQSSAVPGIDAYRIDAEVDAAPCPAKYTSSRHPVTA
jgi:hypothetical protein